MEFVNNGDPWIPMTPRRPILSRPNHIQSEVQGNHMERANWPEPQRPILSRPNWVAAETHGPLMEKTNGQEMSRLILNGPDLIPAELQVNHMERMNRQEPQRPNLIPGEMENQMQNNWLDWSEIEMYGSILQQSTDNIGKTQNVNSVERTDGTRVFQNANSSMVPGKQRGFNHLNNLVGSTSFNQNIGSYGQNPGNCSTLAEVLGMRNTQTAHYQNQTPDKNIHVTDKPVGSNSHSQFEGNYRRFNTVSPTHRNQAHAMSSNAAFDGYNQQYQTQDRFSVPNPTNRNLYPPIMGAVASSSKANLSPFAPVTPNKGVHQLMIRQPDTVEESSTQEKDKQERVAGCIPGDNHSVGLVMNAPDSSSAAISPLQKENGGNGEIDLNKTPQLKPPKRRKHRPKVVVEGKPKRTPKASAPKGSSTPKENPTEKRKYARKKTEKPTSPEKSDRVEASNANNHVKSCRRALNFNIGNETTSESHDKKVETQQHRDQSFDLNLDAQNTTVSLDLNNVCTAQQVETPRNHILSVPEMPIHPSTSAATSKTHTLNTIARNLNIRNGAILYQNSGQNGYSQMVRNAANLNETRGLKRDYYHSSGSAYPQTPALMRSHLLCHEIQTEAHKKMKSEDSLYRIMTSVPSYVNDSSSSSNPRDKIVCKKQENGTNGILTNRHMDTLALNLSYLRQRASHQLHSNTENQYIPSQDHRALVAISNWNDRYPSLSLSGSLQGHETRISPATVSSNTWKVGRASSNQISSTKKPCPRMSKSTQSDQQASTKARELHEGGKYLVTIDRLVARLEGLVISDRSLVQNDQNALVPYKGDGTIIPFEGYNLTKKRKPRPKVDLDPETSRIWNLLMGKEESETTQTMDKDKEKWWEEQRRALHSRAETFMVRMRQVQGDRRFSKWKGSVVDSVIGVFLTQNVSDHLSSSAFMSLAARFPMKETHCQNGVSAWVEEPDIQVIDPDGTITYHQSTENLMKEHINFASEHARTTEEEVISSQTSSESFVLQANEEIRSSSGSSSEAEDQLSDLIFPQHTELRALLQKHHTIGVPLFETTSSMLGCQQPENPGYNTRFDYRIQSNIQCQQNSATTSGDFWLNLKPYLGSEETTHLHSAANNINTLKTADFSYKIMGHVAGSISSSIAQETAAPINHPPGQNGHFSQSTSCDQQEMSKAIQLESTVIADSNPTEANTKRQSEWQIHSASKQSTGNNVSVANARKRKTEGDGKIIPDWDILRKEVQSKNERKGRTKDTMDSMDYEAIRHAEVKEISDAIRERGMNNMLAERIKDFLNRIVGDHGSVDLEWLRDAPPDKAKEYLLSIRGLGLKSVECVRLLTLHNLAFPVDTNVGRIAVRLGWVPLQPLPESLQLHLLELYPILETIQKYLWPRLCKLDQETLYELHYHMITFGKVFCTKSKPNCNACPLRAECRHFASAFASARLALPGPEEKGIVSSSFPISTSGNPTAGFKQMPLLQGISEGKGILGSNGGVETGIIPDFLNKHMPQPPHITSLNRETPLRLITSNCEPIIEEPASPEPPLLEVSASDIEDAYYDHDDPDDIPTIELNMKDFTTNLQNILQEQNMGMQEGDLSKALVALDPAVASIPTPKLKNISHLRTEHQVYELPDGHQLLEGLDRREPDDPSPYLLAIWTPGETANSIQPPETNCNYQASGRLCNENTCFSCSSVREANSQTVRGTILIPCRTATRGSFPLNGTYFQVNEVFADHESSLNPINVPREMIWKLARRTVNFGTSVSTIFKGLSTEQIQYCFWRGFVCVRGFDRKTRAPRPLMARLHFPASRLNKNKNESPKKEVPAAEKIAK